MMQIAVTGSTGFVGTYLCALMDRSNRPYTPFSIRYPLDPHLRMPEVDAIVHLAAIAHSDHPEESFVFDSNLRLPVELAKQAKANGVKQFVFLSSCLVWKPQEEPISLSTPEQPESFYGKAKLEAEKQLLSLSDDTFTVSVVRPSLVYGANVKGNLQKLIVAVSRWPFCPIGVRSNRRSITNVENLCDFILYLVDAKLGGVFTLQDDKPVSSFQILEMISARVPKHKARLIELPKFAWAPIKYALPGIAGRLIGSFYVNDDSASKAGFCPRISREQGFDQMVSGYFNQLNRG